MEVHEEGVVPPLESVLDEGVQELCAVEKVGCGYLNGVWTMLQCCNFLKVACGRSMLLFAERWQSQTW